MPRLGKRGGEKRIQDHGSCRRRTKVTSYLGCQVVLIPSLTYKVSRRHQSVMGLAVGALNYEEVLFITKDFQKKVNTLSH